jgi:DNA-binding PucR family transcriptional regulator
VARSQRSPGASAAPVDSAGAGRGRAERVEALLVGESLDTLRIPYAFDAHHVALVSVGPGSAIDERVRAWSPHLLVRAKAGEHWGWVCKQEAFAIDELEALAAPAEDGELRLAIGEPAHGIAGWRLTHRQARAALSVATRGGEPVVRYADVALLASILKDEVLATSLRRLYLEPLEAGRDGGEEMRQTLRSYFAAGRNVSVAGEAIGVTRQAVARRLRTAEESIGRSIAACGADLEVALRFEQLAATPPSAP